jgi:teichuronic acid biosynthesis glycosyltransferase TuaC
MNVLYLAQDFPTEQRPDACSFLLDQAKYLKRHVNVTVVAPVYNLFPLKRYQELRSYTNSIPPKTMWESLPAYYPRYRYYPGVLRRLSVRSFVRAALKTISEQNITVDIIHAHFLHAAGYAGIKLGQLLNRPVVVTAHGSDVHRFLLRGEGGGYLKKRAQYTLEHADAIVAVSRDIADTIRSVSPAPNLHLVYNGINLSEFKPSVDISGIRGKLSLPEKRIVLYVGNFLRAKGIYDYIAVLDALHNAGKNIHGVAIGRDMTQGDAVAKMKERPYLTCVGPLSHEEVIPYMQCADILLHPSYSEGFGLVIAESLACGCPVVSTTVGAIPEIVSDSSVGLLVPAGDIKQLTQAVEEALKKTWNVQALINRASHFSLEASLKKHFDIYSELLKK